MKRHLIILKGRIPSKKNGKINFVRNGRAISIPSKNYQEWHEDAMWQLALQHIPKDKYDNAIVSIAFFAPDKRATDLTNKAESIMDLLVDWNLLLDDNWFVVRKINLVFGGVIKDNPRAEIEIIYDENLKTQKETDL